MQKTAALAAVTATVLLAVQGLAQPVSSPAIQDRFLREDLALAKTSSLYLVILTKGRTMSLRAGGLTLREWKLAGVRSWGAAQPLESLAIAKKSTLNPPKRTEIIPQTEEQAEQALAEAEKAVKKKEVKKEDQKTQSFELDALELKDMPSSYVLSLSDGTSVYFRPTALKFGPRIASFGHSLSWNFWVPLKNLRYRLKKQRFSAIDLTLETPEDCQSIYWSLAEGAKVLIFPI